MRIPDPLSIRDSCILTYHSTYHIPPRALTGWIHNVHPDRFYRQMRWCKENFDMLHLDTAVEEGGSGSLSVTFDDGNESVFSTALPILEELKIPSTVFINATCLSGRSSWRDKIRILIAKGWAQEFAAFADTVFAGRTFSNDREFFVATKHRDYDSGWIDMHLDLFLAYKNAVQEPIRWHHIAPSRILRHPLVRYGNHSANHYLLASLSQADQETEIRGFHAQLHALGLAMTRYFAVPFGRPQDITPTALRVLRELGYRGYALNCGLAPRGKEARGTEEFPTQGLRRVHRYTVPDSLDALESALTASALGKRAGKRYNALSHNGTGNSIPE